jgi:four helix bundle protein
LGGGSLFIAMIRGNDILDRLLPHAVEITKLCTNLPKNRATTHIAGQLLRSGTAAAPNYAEAGAGESRQDFIQMLAEWGAL